MTESTFMSRAFSNQDLGSGQYVLDLAPYNKNTPGQIGLNSGVEICLS